MICRTVLRRFGSSGDFLPDERKFRRGGSATDEVLSLFAAQTAEGLMQMVPKIFDFEEDTAAQSA